MQNIAFNSVYKLIKSYFSSFLFGADPREEDFIKEHKGKLTWSHWWSHGGGGTGRSQPPSFGTTLSRLSTPNLHCLHWISPIVRLIKRIWDLSFTCKLRQNVSLLNILWPCIFLRGEGREDNLLKINIITDQLFFCFFFSLSFREPVYHFWHLTIEMKVGSLKSFNLLGDHVRPRDYKQFIISW